MVEAAGLRVNGLNVFRRNLRRVNSDLPKGLTALHKELAATLVDAARDTAPRRTGRLASTIRPFGTQKAAAVGAGKKAVPYAGPIHYGWPARNITAQPFLTETIHRHQERLLRDYEQQLSAFIERVWESNF